MNEKQLVVFGHVFKSWAPDKYRIDRRGIKHAFSIIHMFRIKPIKNIMVNLEFKDLNITTKTLDDGYFRFDVPFDQVLKSGWHEYHVTCKVGAIGIIQKGEILKPYPSKVGIISDIDDTFLISHSNSFFKKIFVMLYKNINKRKIFDDVVNHYRHLSISGQDGEEASNSFFYVSSSEWNLYEFINEFAQMHDLPKAVIKLKKIKSGVSDFLFTGRGSHDHKFEKIKDIISFYPHLSYVLLGDDSQKDAFIYERICKIFPKSIRAVYLRQTGKHKDRKVNVALQNINTLNVATCYFISSDKAIAHSKEIGVI